jgi:iron complex transport system permease protein
MFWTLGSLADSSYSNAAILLGTLVVCGVVILSLSRELNAFAAGEEQARHIGVNVNRVKMTVLIAVSALIGISVSISGTIGFVGLVVPHMARIIAGPNHSRLLPFSMFFGAIFLMLCDLAGRIILRPIELPIGVITSFIGSIVFVILYWRSR